MLFPKKSMPLLFVKSGVDVSACQFGQLRAELRCVLEALGWFFALGLKPA